MLYKNVNDENRQAWLKNKLAQLPAGGRILDAGAGELRNRPLCAHLDYVSQDFCEYKGAGDGSGLQSGRWLTVGVDLVCDITSIPEPDSVFDAILCCEVIEHIPEPTKAIKEFARLLKPTGRLILTAPFASLVHMAPYYYYSGFSRYWYEYHLPRFGFRIEELTPNGDWFFYCRQEMMRLGGIEKKCGNWSWPISYVLSFIGALYFKIRSGKKAADLACFGWHCVAVKSS